MYWELRKRVDFKHIYVLTNVLRTKTLTAATKLNNTAAFISKRLRTFEELTNALKNIFDSGSLLLYSTRWKTIKWEITFLWLFYNFSSGSWLCWLKKRRWIHQRVFGHYGRWKAFFTKSYLFWMPEMCVNCSEYR